MPCFQWEMLGRREIAVSGFDFQLLRSVDELRRAAPAWDELWQCSQSANPTARAEPLAEWIEHFAPRAPLGIVLVRDQGQIVAGLPLVGRGPRGLWVGGLPGNVWSPAGSLLIDSMAATSAIDGLTVGLRSLGWPLLVLDAAQPANRAWQSLRAGLDRAGMPVIVRPRFHIDQVEITGDWETYLASRSHNGRKLIRRLLNRAQADMQLRVLDHLAPDEVESWLRLGFTIENSGWKGLGGTSVLKNPEALEFYLRQARHLAGAGELQIVFLEHNGQPIAFEYGWRGKGIYFSLKIAYDETYASRKPGRVLRALLLQRLFTDRQIRGVDFLGPSSLATHDYATTDYPLARMVVGVSRLGTGLLKSYQLLRPLAKLIRSRTEAGQPAANPHEQPAEAFPPLPLPEPVPI
jgi:CelD/BcsL family acetyltransferase involved in cellulose biosynthesis